MNRIRIDELNGKTRFCKGVTNRFGVGEKSWRYKLQSQLPSFNAKNVEFA